MTLKRSACSALLVRALCFLAVTALSGCRDAPPPTLAQAFAARGGPVARARAFMTVAIKGRRAEATRAALLWGLSACDARSPVAAISAFDVARPEGAPARIAARRLEDALASSRSPAPAWEAAARVPWLAAEERTRLRLRGAELLSLQGATVAAAGLLPATTDLRRDDVARALVVTARGGGPSADAAARRVAVEFPLHLGEVSPGLAPGAYEPTFTAAEWAAHAQAWLDAGQANASLRAAGRAGGAGFLIAARASLRLHRPAAAHAWAARGGERCGECWVERADAERHLAWTAAPRDRGRAFGEMLRDAQRAVQLVPEGAPARARAELLAAEALVETGKFGAAAPHLGGEAVASLPRFEWVCRRFVMLAVRASGSAAPGGELARTTRGRRLAAFWTARERARRGDRAGLETLAGSGFPDLPAQWAAQALGRAGVPVGVSAQRLTPQPPPAWASDLMTAGRVADVVLGWRAELEAAAVPGPGWLGLAQLAEMPPLEAIAVLVRGEPRLTAGPWQGLPRELLERYLPLPWRAEVEAAASRTGVPPWVLAGLVRQESAWNPRARSAAGALGLAQVLPDVAAEAARAVPGLAPAGDLLDPGRNLALGAALLAGWRRSFAGSWTAALASYNEGERRTREAWEAAGRNDGPSFVEALEIPETWDYVHRVVLLAEGYRILYWPEGKAYPWT